ncbi:2041_t:CDS:1, partial [Acaulospora morrowiae]
RATLQNGNISDSTHTSIEVIGQPRIDVSTCTPTDVIAKLGEHHNGTSMTTNDETPRKKDGMQITMTYEYWKKAAKSYSSKTAKEYSNKDEATAAELDERNNVEIEECNNGGKSHDPCKKEPPQEPENDDPTGIPKEHCSTELVHENVKLTGRKALMNTVEPGTNDDETSRECQNNNGKREGRSREIEGLVLQDPNMRHHQEGKRDRPEGMPPRVEAEGNQDEGTCPEPRRGAAPVGNHVGEAAPLEDDATKEGQGLPHDKFKVAQNDMEQNVSDETTGCMLRHTSRKAKNKRRNPYAIITTLNPSSAKDQFAPTDSSGGDDGLATNRLHSRMNEQTGDKLQSTVGNSKGKRYEKLDMGVTVTPADPSSTKDPPIPTDHRDQGGGLDVKIGNGNGNKDATPINSDALAKKEFEASRHEHMMGEQWNWDDEATMTCLVENAPTITPMYAPMERLSDIPAPYRKVTRRKQIIIRW